MVIIGNGVGGHRLCQRLMEVEAEDFLEITVLDELPKPRRENVRLGGEVETTSASEEMAQRAAVDDLKWGMKMRLGEAVQAVDLRTRQVETAAATFAYDQLVFVTGGQVRRPLTPGADLPGVHRFHTAGDYRAICEGLSGARSVAVLGSGEQGLLAAQSLCELGVETHLLDRAPRLLPSKLDVEGARLLKAKLESLGIVVHLPARTRQIVPCRRGRKLAIELTSGKAIDVDLVVLAREARPRDELARQAGLEVSAAGGICINDACRTSDDNVFAIGQCAAHEGRVHSDAEPCYEMADVVAKNLLGCRETFKRSDVYSTLKLRSIEVTTVGVALADAIGGIVRSYRRPGVCRNVIVEEGYVVGAMAVGPWPEIAAVREAVQQRRRLMPWQMVRFAATGNLFREPQRVTTDKTGGSRGGQAAKGKKGHAGAISPWSRPATSGS